jgi:D-alanine-D-alanine ligase
VQVLQQGKFERVFIALHGRGGEDGVIQGLLESLGIPYTGSGVLGSALSMDKVRSKQIWQAAQLPTPDFALLEANSNWEAVAERLGLPLAVKPVHEGSSIGAARVSRVAELPAAWQAAARFDEAVMAEPWIEGGEYTVGVLGEQALPVIRLETPRDFYDYQAKYHANDTRYHCPSGLSAEAEADMQALALKAFRALGARGWGRVDVMLDARGQAWLLENNTVPGMTDHSLVPMAAAAAGITFDELVWRILTDAGLGSTALAAPPVAQEVANGG